MKLKPKPLIFASGKFDKNQLKCHISQKEFFSIIHAFKRLRYFLMTHDHPVFVYTDQANLVPLLRPNWNSKLIYGDKMYRWVIQLQQADTLVFNISSTANFAADLLTRWAAGEDSGARVSRIAR